MRRLFALLLMLPVLAGCGKKKCVIPECGKEAEGQYCEEHTPDGVIEGTVEEIAAFATEGEN